jgi:ketosteroid isomerase-like protein
MKKLLLGIIILSFSCSSPEKKSPEEEIAGIIQTELDFARMADEVGVAAAFYYFADDSAVINRGDRIIKGKEAIREYYETSLRPGTKLDWAPDFADVSGDIGYTYGRYTHSVPDSSGNITEHRGIFHTVWKLQDNGSWRFVWD